MNRLRVSPIYLAGHSHLVPELCARIAQTFSVPESAIEIVACSFDPEIAFDSQRGQYNSRVMLRALLDEIGDSEDVILGLTAVDLCIPILTFVFGEAQLGGRAAIVSVHRLRNELFGLPPDEQRLFERLVKEAVHELGHIQGLKHCLNPDCVMHSSTYTEDIDLKQDRFCNRCLPTARGH